MTRDADMIDIGSYWAILIRRRWAFIIPVIVFTVIGIAIAFLLPPVYRSVSTIIIERQAIPSSMIEPTVDSYVQEQIEQIRQRILTYENISEIAKKHNLNETGSSDRPRDIVSEVISNITVAMVNVTATSADKRGKRQATVAFTVSFADDNPKTARDVTEELAQRFLTEHKAVRAERSGQVTTFLEDEAEELRLELEATEEKLARFKQAEFENLPELMTMNLKLFEKTESSIEQSETRVRQYSDKLDSLGAELSLTSPYVEVTTSSGKRLAPAADRLSSMTAEYLQLTSRYSTKHPDVQKLAREIKALAEQSGNSATAEEVLTQLSQQQDKLRESRGRYDSQHPEVLALERSVAALQRGLQTTLFTEDKNTVIDIKPDNPRYVALRSQISATESNLRAEQQKIDQLKVSLKEYEKRLFDTPDVDRELRAIKLDYDSNKRKYREISEQLSDSRRAGKIEKDSKAERFVQANKAFLPTLPESPNRIAILALGLLLGALAGLTSAATAEHLDKTIRGVRSVVNSLGQPPLVVIPSFSKDVRSAISENFTRSAHGDC